MEGIRKIVFPSKDLASVPLVDLCYLKLTNAFGDQASQIEDKVMAEAERTLAEGAKGRDLVILVDSHGWVGSIWKPIQEEFVEANE